ncbi:Amidophosphoribosyltransferase [Smittium culicis]|uniref:Amidophosphoribosyltransferase n=1 Tax=Smittium culicis TaxID=133412 RepID=A0A1R1XTT2_9FUNG|nr:Amidophosphoribosyltransferase [Smittium culicis]OMJ18008.1 Amidophosphoribosyltransferase [Smittium culicis]OMJ20711.1 Amidophosphoribosyltransferase [Smittium culicis]
MCGITGIYLADNGANVAPELLESLNILQHRGQDSAGIITCAAKGRFFQCKGNGMTSEVFTRDRMLELRGNMGIGHNRYPTAGSNSSSEAQPFYVNSPYGIALGHNGNITNTQELTDYLDNVAHRHINTDSDSEVLLNMLATNLDRTGKSRINETDIFNAIAELYKQCHGGYACVAMLAGFGIIGFRDPNAIRPLCIGRRASATIAGKYDYMMASESAALEALEFMDIEPVLPGQVIIITKNNVVKKQVLENPNYTPCIFEYVYFARADSIIDGIPVNDARMAMGVKLAHTVMNVLGKDNDIDSVIPVPDTSRITALQLSQVIGRPYREGFNKNRYVGRTFIMPGQELRRKTVRRKLNAMRYEFEGKNVLIVDDSIVRGTTSKEIVQMAKDAGAKKVYFASAAPPVKYQNVYGIDMPSRNELIAAYNSPEQVAKILGADKVIFQELEDLVDACRQFSNNIVKFDTSVFDGVYIEGTVSEKYLESLENERGENDSAVFSGSPNISGLDNIYER